MEVQLARLEERLAALEAKLSALHGAWPAALVLPRKLVRELKGAAREVAEVRLILRDSPKSMAKQNRGDLLSTPSLLREGGLPLSRLPGLFGGPFLSP